MATQFVTPVGRLVQGDPFKPQTTDKTGKPLTVKTGPNAGQPAKKFFIAVAFDKNNPEFGPFWQKIVAEAKAGFPQLVNQQGQIMNPRFSWKLVDGDGVDADGNPNNVKPGFAGHWIVRFQSNYPPKLVHNGRYIDDAAAAAGAIKPGYYVTVAGDCVPNTGAEIPGLYMNLAAVELVGWGEEIRTGVDAVGAFSSAAAGRQYMPQGMLQQPPAPLPSTAMQGQQPMQQQVPMQPGMPMQQQVPMQPGMPMQQQAPMQPGMPMQQQVPSQPNHAFVQNAIGQQPQGMRAYGSDVPY